MGKDVAGKRPSGDKIVAERPSEENLAGKIPAGKRPAGKRPVPLLKTFKQLEFIKNLKLNFFIIN